MGSGRARPQTKAAHGKGCAKPEARLPNFPNIRESRKNPKYTKDGGRFDRGQILPEEIPAPIWLENSHLGKEGPEAMEEMLAV